MKIIVKYTMVLFIVQRPGFISDRFEPLPSHVVCTCKPFCILHLIVSGEAVSHQVS